MPETNVPGGHRAIPVADLTPGRGQRATWIVAVTVSLSIAVFVVFGVGSSTANFGEDSPLAHKYTEVLPGPPGTAPQAIFKDAWGTDSGIRTLVLYDTEGSASAMADAETHAIVTANLATHFGHVQTAPMKDYASGDMAGYDGVVYMGSTSAGSLSMAFQKDMLKDRTPVLWAGGNIAAAAVADRRVNAEFIETYGWDPATSKDSGEEHIDGVTYQGHSLTRNGSAAGPVLVPRITDKGMVDILARTTGSRTHPWAIRSANLTYIGENPLTYVDETDRYLAFADLFYDLLAPDTAPVRQAALRLEDVDAAASPEDLYAITDFLHERGVPFQVAVIPIRLSRTPGGDPDSWVGLSLGDRPDVVKALRYMQQHGGTLIQHGTTHQYGTLDNPYSGSSGADFEFYRAECSATPGPTPVIEPCTNDSYIVDTGPVGSDSVDGWVQRLTEGQQVFADLGLGDVTVFETPHYLASSNAYTAISKVFEYRYERSHYFPGQLSGDQAPYQRAMDQFFPYTVRDIYGTKVLPENLGNITEEEQNNHAVRDTAFIVGGARANLAVRQSTASFFYHPFLGVEQLRETVEGIQALGYTFVPAMELT